jgi:putative transcriptional regulator
MLPEPLRGYAGGDVGSLGWKTIAEGVEEVDLRVGRGGVRTRLLRLPGGAGLPGPVPGPIPDLIMVLAGALADERGLHRRGDVLLSGPGPAAAGEGCICIVVSGERLRLDGPAYPFGF